MATPASSISFSASGGGESKVRGPFSGVGPFEGEGRKEEGEGQKRSA